MKDDDRKNEKKLNIDDQMKKMRSNWGMFTKTVKK